MSLLISAFPATSSDHSNQECPQCRQAERLFRETRFDEAAALWQTALELNPAAARAHWGLGRIEMLHSRRLGARDHFAAAYRLDWRDPDIVLSYAGFVVDASMRDRLLENFTTLAQNGAASVQDALAQIEIDRRVHAKRLSVVGSPYQAYRLALEPWTPDGIHERGLLVHARIEHGSPVRLLLDTGAHGITVWARGSRLEPIAQARFNGFGSTTAINAWVGAAKKIAFNELEFENCLIHVAETAIVPGLDGVIGTDAFQQFQIRLDARSRVLELFPFAKQPEPPSGVSDVWMGEDASSCANCSGLQETVRIGNLFLVKAPRELDARSGYFLLDTGSSYNALSTQSLHSQGRFSLSAVGARGSIEANALAVRDPNLIAVDLSSINNQQGVQISGIIGYPAIRKLVLTIDYRDGIVGFVPHSR